ncbi:tyrosine-type recombinase/integrase [Rhizobium sp. NRK18]|uniref:tyrosine-type recombinase/integrase n=1 Tax=Rhizobium sp. NRK18 TaxID=2964667 RepID=UPI0021C2E36E|nr:site-specific integrase [Rhizobium sp. NRK18]MCQ2005699.1 site-specific integrase [Rhizobium sp. NRK18]
MPRKYDPTKVRKHWVYSRDDLKEMYGVSDSTILNWIRAGLETVDIKRPQLFAGYKVRRFITRMRWPDGRSPQDGRIHCSVCLGFKTLITGTIKTFAADTNCLLVTGMCTDCHNMLQADIPADEVPEIFASAINIPGHSSDVSDDGASGETWRNGASLPTETHSGNLRWLYDYRVFLERNRELDRRTVDEHLRALARMSAFLDHKPFEQVSIGDVCSFKDELRRRRSLEGDMGLSWSTLEHTLDRCGAFFGWFQRRPDIELDPDLPGYFQLSRRERAAGSSMVKGTSLTFDLALCLFAAMPGSTPIEVRNRAVIAMLITTGIRVKALVTLRGKHVNTHTRWINQDPREVSTKYCKHIRTYCLDLGAGLLDAIRDWARWREMNGFGAEAPFFLPDRYIQSNAIGFGYRSAETSVPECWKSDDPIQRIIKDAAQAAKIPENKISSHDFRKILHPFLSKRGSMAIIEEVALQLNLGHEPGKTIRKYYASMQDSEREEILDELCRRALSHRTELELYLAFERGEITPGDPDYERAKDIFERYMKR